MKRILFTLTWIVMSSIIVACHTVEGAGEDIQAGGRSIERAAQ